MLYYAHQGIYNSVKLRYYRQSMKRPHVLTWSQLKRFQGFFKSLSHKPSTRHVPDSIAVPAYIKFGYDSPPALPEIKSKDQIDSLRRACRLASSILDNVEKNLRIGITTNEIDDIVHELCIESKAYPSPLLYKGFPKSVCTSVNEVACHGIPSSLALKNGDIINVDVTVFHDGFHGDTSRTFLIGDVSERDRQLVDVAEQCRDVAIEMCHHDALLSDIGEAIYYCASQAGFGVIPNFCGHGIGSYFHGPPNIIHVPNYLDEGGRMKAGMTFTIEPIICDGSPEIEVLDDGWTVVSKDGGKSAQFEHTVLVTKDGVEILT